MLCERLLLYWVVPDALVCVCTLKYDQLGSYAFLLRQHVQMSELIVIQAVTQIRGCKQTTGESIFIPKLVVDKPREGTCF